MSCVLLIDDDASTLATFKHILSLAGFVVHVSSSGEKGLVLAVRHAPDVILIDLNLPDISGIEILKRLSPSPLVERCVIMTGFGTASSAVNAMRLGAFDYVEKPITDIELVAMVERVIHRPNHISRQGLAPSVAHATTRWANAVVRAIESPTDPKTLSAWGRAIAASSGALRNWCRTANLSPKRSLDFARILRAVVRHKVEGSGPEDLLDAIDTRTLTKLLMFGNPSRSKISRLPHDPEEFLRQQRWIRNNKAIIEVRRLLLQRSEMKANALSHHNLGIEGRTR